MVAGCRFPSLLRFTIGIAIRVIQNEFRQSLFSVTPIQLLIIGFAIGKSCTSPDQRARATCCLGRIRAIGRQLLERGVAS